MTGFPITNPEIYYRRLDAVSSFPRPSWRTCRLVFRSQKVMVRRVSKMARERREIDCTTSDDAFVIAASCRLW